MKYAKIAAILGWTETPDSQDGLFLQTAEADKLNTTITEAEAATAQAATDHANAIAKVNGELATANSKVTVAEGKLSTANTAVETLTGQLNTSNTALQTATTRIAELEALSGKPSGTTTDEDPANADNKTDMKKYHCSYDEMFS